MDQLRTLCVMGTFDNQTNQTICQIKEKLQIQGITIDAYEPHITFGIYTMLDDTSLVNWIASIAAQQNKLSLSFNHFGFFPDVHFCFLSPCPSFDLLNLHQIIHQRYDTCCTDKGCLYSVKQKSWAPHMTIATVELSQAQSVIATLWNYFSPFTAQLTQLKITSSDTNKVIGVFDLQA